MSATGTAIQAPQVGPRAAVLMCAVLVATLGVGFFAGRITESGRTTAPAAIYQPAPGVASQTDGAAVGTGGPAIGGLAPHVPKRVDATEATSDRVGSNHLPKQWHM